MARIDFSGPTVYFSTLNTMTQNSATFELNDAVFVSTTKIFYGGATNKISNISPVVTYSAKVAYLM